MMMNPIRQLAVLAAIDLSPLLKVPTSQVSVDPQSEQEGQNTLSDGSDSGAGATGQNQQLGPVSFPGVKSTHQDDDSLSGVAPLQLVRSPP